VLYFYFKKPTNSGELYSKGNSLIERSLYLVHLLDFVSVFLADMNHVDAVEVKVIDFLKGELAKS